MRPEPTGWDCRSGKRGTEWEPLGGRGLAWSLGVGVLAPTGDAAYDEDESHVQGAEARARGLSLPRQVLRCG